MVAHKLGVEKVAVHLFHCLAHVRTYGCLAAVLVEGEDGIAEEIRVAQQEDVAEGLAVPVGGPVVLGAKEVGERGGKANVPAVDIVAVPGLRAALAGKLHVDLGQDEEERGGVPLAALGCLALREANPVVDGARQILHFLVARTYAQEHAREFLLVAVALEEIGHLATQEEGLFQGAGACQGLAQIVGLQARPVARKVQKVRVGKKRVWLMGHVDGELCCKSSDKAAWQIEAFAIKGRDFQLLVRTLRVRGEQGHVDDAL